MRVVWVILAAIAGGLVGACVGFGVALVAMSFTKNPNDGSYGMIQVLIGVPAGALCGLIAGVAWVLRLAPG